MSHVALIRALLWLMIAAGTALAQAENGAHGERGIRVISNEKAGRVDVLVDGKPFTSYIFTKKLTKPVLFPLLSAQGTPITRGFPLAPRAGERVDHPHHVGLWFSYGDVNGVDFWNNSTALEPRQMAKMGFIIHRKVVRAVGGKERGELEVTLAWLMPGGKTILREDTTFIFHAGQNARAIDRITRLTALNERVAFKDNKEGVFGLRVRRELEQPSDKPEAFTDASGNPTTVAVLDNEGVSGIYRSSEGKTGDSVWGTRGRWVMLSGRVGDERITLAIFDHPANPGHPTYWHARGYGLFAANPFGQRVFSNGKEQLNFTLEPKQSVTFRHRLLILSSAVAPEKIEAEFNSFARSAALLLRK
jgi:hypothetical protein